MPIQIPVGAEENFAGIIDLVTMRQWIWNSEDLGASWTETPVAEIKDEELKKQAYEWRDKLVEAAVEMDDDAMMEYLVRIFFFFFLHSGINFLDVRLSRSAVQIVPLFVLCFETRDVSFSSTAKDS